MCIKLICKCHVCFFGLRHCGIHISEEEENRGLLQNLQKKESLCKRT
jgi:hypothetical protein